MIRKPWYCPRALDWQTPTECLENHSQSTKEPARKGNADTRRHTHRQLARNEAQPAACHENQATPTGPPSQPPQYLTTMRSTTGSTTATATATAMTVAKTRNMGDYPHHTAATPFENIQFIPYRSRSRLPSMVLLSVVIVDALWFGGAGVCCASAFSVAPTAYRAVGGVPLRAILLRKEEAFVDGGEWESVDPILSQDADLGYVTAVIGQNEETNERFVAVESVSGKDGLQIGEDCVVFQDSIATIPINNPKLTDDRAIATLLSTLSVHRTLSLLRKTKDKPESTKVVVVGDGDHGVFLARAFATCNVETYLIITGKIPSELNGKGVTVMSVVDGDDKIGFAEDIGEFDALIDVHGDERTAGPPFLRNLASQHGCGIYVTTRTESMRIVTEEGLLWGPSIVNRYLKQCGLGERSAAAIIPPDGFGQLLSKLFAQGVVSNWKWTRGTPALRSWSLTDFWNVITWPRDAESNARFGFPMPPALGEDDGDGEKEEEDTKDEVAIDTVDRGDVKEVSGVRGVTLEIVAKERDCVLLLSGQYCKACKYLVPQYYRYARQKADSNIFFATADTTSAAGKDLGRSLSADSVPSFVLFRKGKQLGEPLAVTRLPSDRLESAIQDILEGMESQDSGDR